MNKSPNNAVQKLAKVIIFVPFFDIDYANNGEVILLNGVITKLYAIRIHHQLYLQICKQFSLET
jgi:hypothetical protein